MGMVKLNPNREILSMMDAMQRLFDETAAPLDYMGGQRAARLPIDAYTTENEIVVIASIPGANPEEVEITIEGDSLTIRGEIPQRLDNVRYIFTERFHGAFTRTLQLNVPVDVENVEATFENGLLTLHLPKAEEAKPKVIKVKAG
jgi:HSP20 family protein